MKANSVSNSRIVPKLKCCIHRNGMTAVVSETDSVYLYSGGSGKSLRMLAFNPKSGQAVYIDEGGAEHCPTQELIEKNKGANEIYEKGLKLLEIEHYSQPQSEEEKVYEWMKSLQDRPSIDPDELKHENRLVAAILTPSSDKPNDRMNLVRCFMLGDCIGRGVFRTENDPDLDYGSLIQEHPNQKISVSFFTDPKTCGLSGDLVVQLTREDTKWLRGLLPPFPANHFLYIHREAVETIEVEKRAKENERARRILRGVSRADGKTDPFGTVAI